jgi:hypothetical protein
MVRRLVPAPFAAAIAGTAAVALLSACGGGSPPSGPAGSTAGASPRSASSTPSFSPRPRDFRAIRTLMAARAKAVLADDEAAFLATVDPRQPKLAAQQRTLFGNLRQLGVTGLTYGVDTSALVPARVPGGDPVLHPEVVEHLRMPRTLAHPVSNQVDMTFVRRHGHWLVGAVSQPKETGHFDSPQERPWFGVPVVVRRDGPLTVLVDRSAADSLDRLTTAIRSDIAYDARLLGVPASYRVLVDATTNGLAYDFSSVSREEAAAVTFGLVATDPLGDRATGLAGTAIKVNPTLVDDEVSDAGILRHELTHYLLRQYAGSSPKWLTEGVATWVQYYPDDFSQLHVPPALYDSLRHADRALPSIGLFNTDPSLNYPISQAAVAALVDRGGVSKLVTLMKAYRSRYQGVDADALTPQLLRQVYGETVAAVVRDAFAKLARLRH